MPFSAENIRFILGLKLKNLRQEHGLSLKDLAGRSGLSVSYLSEIEKGKKYPKPDKLLGLAQAFGISFDELVSLKVGAEFDTLKSALSSPFMREFPFELFGVSAEDLFALVTDDPLRAGALFRTFIEIVQMYDMRVEHFLFAAMRSYQKLNNNYFEDLEQAAQAFRASQNWPHDQPLDEQDVRRVLETRYRYRIDTTTLPQHPDLNLFRSVFAEGPPHTLYVNGNLLASQRGFLFGRELGFRSMNMTTRPKTSSWIRAERFDHVLNNFKASYFSGALFIDRNRMRDDLTRFFQRNRWDGDRFLAYINELHVTPEMVFYRIMEVLPHLFGIDNIYFLRYSNKVGTDVYRLTKVFNMSGLPVPHKVGEDEAFCERWPAKRILRTMSQQQEYQTVIDVQRTYFVDEDAEFFVISVARALALSSDRNSCVSLGLLIDDTVKEQIAFWNDPNVPRHEVQLIKESPQVQRVLSAVNALLDATADAESSRATA
ncbi:MAG: hypothetical protein RhofKO_37310 [Rhodothermales bacterium]